MTAGDLRKLRGEVKLLWSGLDTATYWPDTSLRFAAPRFAQIELETAEKALAALFDEGRDYPPGLSVLLARARAIAEEEAAARPRLAEPDHTRLPSAEELARMESWRPRLRAAAEAAARRGRPVSSAMSHVVDRLGIEVPAPGTQPITTEED